MLQGYLLTTQTTEKAPRINKKTHKFPGKLSFKGKERKKERSFNFPSTA
jgi:hypothetical protein